MTPRQVREGRAVRLVDPPHVAFRFWSPIERGIIGAGRVVFPRHVIDGVGEIIAHDGPKRRVLIGWPAWRDDGNNSAGLWIDVDQIQVAP